MMPQQLTVVTVEYLTDGQRLEQLSRSCVSFALLDFSIEVPGRFARLPALTRVMHPGPAQGGTQPADSR